jgi:hypothetical protein
MLHRKFLDFKEEQLNYDELEGMCKEAFMV